MMQINLLIKRQKDFLLSKSWLDSFIQWLHKLPLPFSLTCTFIGVVYFFSFLDYRQVLDGVWILFSFVFSFSLAYSIYLVWHFEEVLKSLFDNLSIFKEKNIEIELSETKPKWLLVSLSSIRAIIALSVFLFLVIGWKSTENLLQVISVSWLFIMFNLIFSVTTKILKIISTIYKLKSQVFEINLWDLSPLYQLSQTTQKIALYLLPLPTVLAPISFVLTMFFYQGGGITLSGWKTNTVFLFVQIIYASFGPLLIFIDILIFILPTFWIRERILETKKNLGT
jgi:hypothetical protein